MFRIKYERFWLRNRISNLDKIIVQTFTMSNFVKKLIFNNYDLFMSPAIKILPFRSSLLSNANALKPNRLKKFDFIYVASYMPHKNHSNLIMAWKILAEENIFPSLLLTIDNFSFGQISEDIINSDLAITNLGPTDCKSISKAYLKTNALIYPSLCESLGLPLLEAREFGLSILASELDFVRDIVTPIETFDPCSAISISRAVKRFLGYELEYSEPVSPKIFLNEILSSIK